MKILIPMAGNGQRFVDAGYIVPKPLIKIHGETMISHVVASLSTINKHAEYIFICKEDHIHKYDLDVHLNEIAPNNTIITVNKTTEGAACTSLLAEEYIDNDDELVIANSDQIVVANIGIAINQWKKERADGGIFLFEASDPKWSFAKCVDNLQVLEVAEKNPISHLATCGIYWYNRGSQYVRYAKDMINQNIRVNNEFYICPVYNEYILDWKKIMGSIVWKMDGVGTPEDLNNFLAVNSE